MALFNLSFLLLLNILTARYFFIIFYFFGIFDLISLNISCFREIVCERPLFNLLLKRRRLPLINIYYKKKRRWLYPFFRKFISLFLLLEAAVIIFFKVTLPRAKPF